MLQKIPDFCSKAYPVETYKKCTAEYCIKPEALVDAVANIFDEKRANALVRKAMKLKVPVSEEMFQDLSGMVSPQVAKKLRDYCGLNKKYFFDTESLAWLQH